KSPQYDGSVAASRAATRRIGTLAAGGRRRGNLRRPRTAEPRRELRVDRLSQVPQRIPLLQRRKARHADVDRAVEPELVEPPLHAVGRKVGRVEGVVAAAGDAAAGGVREAVAMPRLVSIQIDIAGDAGPLF